MAITVPHADLFRRLDDLDFAVLGVGLGKCMGVGSKEGAASPGSVASHAAVKCSRTLRCGCLSVATTVIIASTNLEPSALWVPKMPLRQSTPGRIARSAALFVGSTAG
jgi:hypothetical protein